jgi:uncharacterized membrane protein YdjX (TVP38/TMEM64 family)
METSLMQVFENSGLFAIFLSIIINIVISILGVVPSFFITAANISFFGFGNGLLISIMGEALGAILSFYLYRKGIRKVKTKVTINNKYLMKLEETDGVEAFIIVMALRVFPFIPSGLVTLISASSKVGILNFSIASTLGKIPALLIEAYSIQQILDWSWQGKVILGITSLLLLTFFINKRKNRL